MQTDHLQRHLAAILAADMVGFSSRMAADEEGTLASLNRVLAELVNPAIAAHGGRVFKTTGDGLLAEFPSVVAAVKCATQVQIGMASHNAGASPVERVLFRVGINLGDVIRQGDDVFGDGVNIAARLEGLCRPGGITLSASAYEQVRDRITHRCIDRGEHVVKNIARPVRVYDLDVGEKGDAARAARGSSGVAPARRDWVRPTAAIAAVAVIAGALAVFTGLSDKLAALLPGSRVAVQQTDGTERAAIAVLPFSDQGDDARREYFSDGMTEDVINALGRFSGIRVSAYNAVRPYKGRNPTHEEIGRELGVRYVAQGSVRRTESRLRVSVQLSDARTGALLWSDRYEDDLGKVFEIQDRIVMKIVGALAVKLTRLEQQRAFAKPTDSLEAYDLVLRARALLNRVERSASVEARALLEKAIQLAPQYAEAYVVFSVAEYYRGVFGWVEDVEDAVRRSERLAKHALALDDPGAHARAYASLATAYAFLQRLDEALIAADRALELNPSDYVSYETRGSVLLWLGKIDEAIAAKQTALQFSPRLEPSSGVSFALAYYMAGRYRDAIALADPLLLRAPQNVFLHAVRAASLAQLGEMEEAKRAAQRVQALSPFFQVEVFGSRFVKPEHRAQIQAGLRKAGL